MKYYYAWKNNPKRKELYGRRFNIIARGKKNSVLVEFENGQREVISGNAIRKIKDNRDQEVIKTTEGVQDSPVCGRRGCYIVGERQRG